MKDIKAYDLDALILPGGFGAAKNLSDFAINGASATVNSEVKRILEEMVEAKKPVGAICIAPATLTKAIPDKKPAVTIGNDQATASAIETMGGLHKTCAVDLIHFDKKNKIVTTPAYMLGPSIKHVAEGIQKLVDKVLQLVA